MDHLRAYIEELCEGSYTESDIPDKFYLVIRKLDDDVCKNLVNHELRGVKGVSASRNILPAWLDVRDVAIEMDGKEFERLNKLSKIGYDNPDYLVSNDFAALLRIKDMDRPKKGTNEISPYTYDQAFKQILESIDRIGFEGYDAEWLRAVLCGMGSDKNTDKLYGYSEIVIRDGFPTINSVNDFVNWIWSNKHRITERSPYSYSDYGHEAYDQSKLNKARIDKIIRMALTEFGLHYRDREAEWLIKKEWIEGGQDRVLRIPKRSRLIVKRDQPSEWAHNSAQYNEMYVEHYGLDKLYRITWVNPKKYEKAATKQSEKHWDSVKTDRAKWRNDVRKAHEKEIQRDAKLKQLAAARDAKKAKLAQQKQVQSAIAAESFWLDGLDLSEATLYHGSKFPDIVECEEGICLAYKESVAGDYALNHWKSKNNPPTVEISPSVYEVEVRDGIRIASVSDLMKAAAASSDGKYDVWYYKVKYRTMPHILSDDPKVRSELVKHGFDAVEFPDLDSKGKSHKTLRILNPAVVKIIGRKQVK